MVLRDGHRMRVFVPRLTPGNSAAKLTWKQLAGWKKKWMRDFAILARPQLPKKPIQFAHVVITRISTGEAPDYDNLNHSAKWPLDVLCPPAKGKFQIPHTIKDDKPGCIGRPQLRWLPARSEKDQGVLIQVIECLEEDLDLGPWPTIDPAGKPEQWEDYLPTLK